MAASSHLPKSIKAETTDGLEDALQELQTQLMAKVAVISIYYDTKEKQHVCWYYAPMGLAGFSGM